MSGLSLAGSGLTLEQSSGGGSASNGFPITSGQSGVVSSGGSIIILSGGIETISGTETIASGGSLIIAAGGSETVSGTETIASGGSLSIASGGSEVVSPGGSLTVSSGAVLSVTSGAVISSGTAQTLVDAQGSAGLNPLHPGGFVAGRWYTGPMGTTGSSTTLALVSGTLYATLFYVPEVVSFTALGNWINTSTTANLLWGAYGPITPTQFAAVLSGAPKLGATTSAAISATSAMHSAAFGSAMRPGWYVGCVMADAACSATALAGVSSATAGYLLGFATGGVPTISAGFTVAGQTFGNGMPANLPVMTAVAAASVAAVQWMK